jgi:hypothetical protein
VEPAGANIGHTRIDVARDPRYLAHRIVREDQLDALRAEQRLLRMSRERPMTTSENQLTSEGYVFSIALS